MTRKQTPQIVARRRRAMKRAKKYTKKALRRGGRVVWRRVVKPDAIYAGQQTKARAATAHGAAKERLLAWAATRDGSQPMQSWTVCNHCGVHTIGEITHSCPLKPRITKKPVVPVAAPVTPQPVYEETTMTIKTTRPTATAGPTFGAIGAVSEKVHAAAGFDLLTFEDAQEYVAHMIKLFHSVADLVEHGYQELRRHGISQHVLAMFDEASSAVSVTAAEAMREGMRRMEQENAEVIAADEAGVNVSFFKSRGAK